MKKYTHLIFILPLAVFLVSGCTPLYEKEHIKKENIQYKPDGTRETFLNYIKEKMLAEAAFPSSQLSEINSFCDRISDIYFIDKETFVKKTDIRSKVEIKGKVREKAIALKYKCILFYVDNINNDMIRPQIYDRNMDEIYHNVILNPYVENITNLEKKRTIDFLEKYKTQIIPQFENLYLGFEN